MNKIKRPKIKARVKDIIGPTPRLMPGDKAGAEAYRQVIVRALRQGSWTQPVWGKLYRMERHWYMRSKGLDKNYELYGTLERRQDVDDPIYMCRDASLALVLWEIHWILYEAELELNRSEGQLIGYRGRKEA